MSDQLNYLLTQAILAAQARFEDAEKIAIEAAKAYAAGQEAFKKTVPGGGIGMSATTGSSAPE